MRIDRRQQRIRDPLRVGMGVGADRAGATRGRQTATGFAIRETVGGEAILRHVDGDRDHRRDLAGDDQRVQLRPQRDRFGALTIVEIKHGITERRGAIVLRRQQHAHAQTVGIDAGRIEAQGFAARILGDAAERWRGENAGGLHRCDDHEEQGERFRKSRLHAARFLRQVKKPLRLSRPARGSHDNNSGCRISPLWKTVPS
jgi:post-segregation antitoxin (ccd killing protein)